MAITPEIPLSNLLSVVVVLFVHPPFARVCHAAVGFAPVEVLARVGPLVAAAVLEALVRGGEVLGVGGGVSGELVVPGESGTRVTGVLGSFVAG